MQVQDDPGHRGPRRQRRRIEVLRHGPVADAQQLDRGVPVRPVLLQVPFAQGEEMRTEVSAKFRREGLEAELRAAGLRLEEWWTDPAGDFALSLSALPGGGRRRL